MPHAYRMATARLPHAMMKRFADADNWFYDGRRYVNEIVYSGPDYAVCPGIPSRWEKQVETFLKTHVYTCEKDIDWSVELIAQRDHYGIHRGARFEMDPWLYEMVYSNAYSNRHIPYYASRV